MRHDSLPSPGLLSSAQSLRHHAARSISEIQIAIAGGAGGGSGKTVAAAKLQAFFTACATALNAYVESVLPTGVFARVSNTSMTMTFSEAMDSGTPPLDSISGTGIAVTGFAWTSPTVATLTGTGFTAGKSITYTKPTSGYALQDRAGNALATFSTTI